MDPFSRFCAFWLTWFCPLNFRLFIDFDWLQLFFLSSFLVPQMVVFWLRFFSSYLMSNFSALILFSHHFSLFFPFSLFFSFFYIVRLPSFHLLFLPLGRFVTPLRLVVTLLLSLVCCLSTFYFSLSGGLSRLYGQWSQPPCFWLKMGTFSLWKIRRVRPCIRARVRNRVNRQMRLAIISFAYCHLMIKCQSVSHVLICPFGI